MKRPSRVLLRKPTRRPFPLTPKQMDVLRGIR
jgi:hypothetical protein